MADLRIEGPGRSISAWIEWLDPDESIDGIAVESSDAFSFKRPIEEGTDVVADQREQLAVTGRSFVKDTPSSRKWSGRPWQRRGDERGIAAGHDQRSDDDRDRTEPWH
jgi:hypothetical protein